MTARSNRAARARLSLALSNHVVADFATHGAEVVAKLRCDRPLDYVKLVNAILEREEGDAAAAEPKYSIVERRIIRPEDGHG